MAYLKDRIQQGRQYTGSEDQIRDHYPGLTFDWPWFLSGFFTAEGWLGIYRAAPGVLKPRLAIRLRQDDRPLLTQIRDRTDAGRIYTEPRKAGAPVAQWIVFATADLPRIVEVFDRYPPKGRKRDEYEIWRDAVVEYARVRPARLAYDRLDRLRLALREARHYRPPTETRSQNPVDITRPR